MEHCHYQNTLDIFPDGFFDSPARKGKTRYNGSRGSLTRIMRGIDGDIVQLFLNLPLDQLDTVFQKYRQKYGQGKLDYARQTYPLWKSGQVEMSGVVAERLLNLVPSVLDTDTRFKLVKKLRQAYMRKETRRVTCCAFEWREHVAPVINELGKLSKQFRLPDEVLSRAEWLANGDAEAAHKLLAAAEREEARILTQYLDDEFRQIDEAIDSLDSMDSVSHTISIPQGTVIVTIRLPPRTFWGWLRSVILLESY